MIHCSVQHRRTIMVLKISLAQHTINIWLRQWVHWTWLPRHAYKWQWYKIQTNHSQKSTSQW
jgi:hypothetical protein